MKVICWNIRDKNSSEIFSYLIVLLFGQLYIIYEMELN